MLKTYGMCVMYVFVCVYKAYAYESGINLQVYIINLI